MVDNSSKARFKRIVAGRIARGEHYITAEKLKAQHDFYQSVQNAAKVQDDKVCADEHPKQ